MASAVLPSRNETYWGERKVYMRKYTNSNSSNINKPRHFNNFNPNPNPNNTTTQIHDSSRKTADPPSRPAPPIPPAASDDEDNSSSSLNRKPNDYVNGHGESSSHGGDGGGGYVTYNLATYSRRELKELKRRLISELDQVRTLRSRIEFRSGVSLRVDSTLVSPKEKRTPTATFAPSKNKKRPIPFGSGRDPKKHHHHNATASSTPNPDKLMTNIMRRCAQILGKLMKHKHSWVFNTPVDVAGLGLHDYNQIIKQPMDLGTVKCRLSKKEYGSPLDFASDIRLTFNNAMKYNARGSDVFIMAETLLGLFEEMFNPSYNKFAAASLKPARMIPLPEKLPSPPPPPPPVVEVNSNPVDPVVNPASPAVNPVRVVSKLPKPKAREANKRLMSFEEKAKLGLSLQSLPHEKMDPMLQIIEKRNKNVAQEGDEIELDIEVLDNETLWELDRFVSNHKKTESKTKRQGLMSSSNPSSEPQINKSPVREPTPEVAEAAVKSSRKGGDAGEEDVDIGEEIPINNFPPVEIEKDDAACDSSSSSGSSSSSDSSSSSGSDSGSSSGSDDSDEEDSVQSPCVVLSKDDPPT